MLEIDPKASAVVVAQRIAPLGFDGEVTILRDYLRKVRGRSKKRQPFIRFESPPGHQCQIDWGHFGSLTYGNTKRKLSCMAVMESFSRLLYLEFTHSQRQETPHRCLLNAFGFFNGTPKELVHDNMLTAVIERDGPLIRFNEAFLQFLLPFKIVPIACNVASPHEKGKIEKGAIHYIRYNFWPLRSFTDLKDLQAQADHWRDHIANLRLHNTTGQKPIDRFKVEAMRPLPDLLSDCRDTALCKGYPDFSIRSTTEINPSPHIPAHGRKETVLNCLPTGKRPENINATSGVRRRSLPSSVSQRKLKLISNISPLPINPSKRTLKNSSPSKMSMGPLY